MVVFNSHGHFLSDSGMPPTIFSIIEHCLIKQGEKIKMFPYFASQWCCPFLIIVSYFPVNHVQMGLCGRPS